MKVGYVKCIFYGIKVLCGGVFLKLVVRIEWMLKVEEKVGRSKKFIDKEDSY